LALSKHPPRCRLLLLRWRRRLLLLRLLLLQWLLHWLLRVRLLLHW